MGASAMSEHVCPTLETLRHWADHLLPTHDVWYWDDGASEFDLTGSEVMSRADYLEDPAFRDIRFVNAYLHWQMPSEVTKVIVSEPEWIVRLSEPDRRRVLSRQVEVRRGLVYWRSHFSALPPALQTYLVNEFVVLCHAAWNAVPAAERLTVLVREQRRWDAVDCCPAPDHVPDHIRAIANTFVKHEGTNCLATTSFCITGERRQLDLWMLQSEFSEFITRMGFRPAMPEAPGYGDIVTFAKDGRIVHAAYCVGDDRFLTKNGQSRFNPIRIVDWASLSGDWRETQMAIHWRQADIGNDWSSTHRSTSA